MSIQTIYAKLVRAGMTPESACGMMGNMDAESAMRSNNAQDGMSRLSDEEYTRNVDLGAWDFINDSIGYGLCQWTYPGRKRNLLNFARSRGVSIGDEAMQVDFCIHEFRTEYASLWQWLCTNKGVQPAAERICREYERPAVNNVEERAGYANQFYMTLGGMDVSGGPDLGTVPDNSPTGEPEDAIFHTPAGGSAAPVPAAEIYWPPRVLAFGMAGPDVVALQGLLIAHGCPAGISGTFDAATDSQLKAWQGAKGLKADGIAGPKSWAELVKGV